MSEDECIQVTRLVYMSIDDCRWIKNFSLTPEKVTHGLILLLLQLCNCRPRRYTNFKFCSFVCDYCSSKCFRSSSYIKKTYFPIVLLNVGELELNWCAKDQPNEKGASHLLNGAFSIHRGMPLPNAVQCK